MSYLKVWHSIKLDSIPHGRKPIKCKWVFDIKSNGTFCVCLVACGYSQIPVIDFEEFYAPVVNDSAFQTIFTLQLLLNLDLDSKILDVKNTFLHIDLQEYINMHSKGNNIQKG
jgi:hypothetical protein